MTEKASFWDHLEELRGTLVKILWIILFGTGIAFIFHETLVDFLIHPMQQMKTAQGQGLETLEIKVHRVLNKSAAPVRFDLPKEGKIKTLSSDVLSLEKNSYTIPTHHWLEWEQSIPPFSLQILNPVEGMVISLKISVWAGLVLTSPLWLFYIFRFIAPALHEREKFIVLPFLCLSCFFIFLGALFAYKLTIPIANDYLYSFNENIGLNLWSFSHYLDYTLVLIVSHAVAFELFVILLLCIHFGFLNVQTMKDKRRHVIVAAFILSAILTPPDVLSQILMAIPLIGLYELAILYAYFKHNLRQKDANIKNKTGWAGITG